MTEQRVRLLDERYHEGEFRGWLKRTIGFDGIKLWWGKMLCAWKIWIWYTEREGVGREKTAYIFIHNAWELDVSNIASSSQLNKPRQQKHEQIPNHPSNGRDTVSELQNWSAEWDTLDIDTSPCKISKIWPVRLAKAYITLPLKRSQIMQRATISRLCSALLSL